MSGDVHALARGKLAKAIRSGHFSDGVLNEWLAADAVLAVLPELLTDERVLVEVRQAIYEGLYINEDDWTVTTRLALQTAAEMLAGAS